LGDLDQDQWEDGPDGKPRDAWQNTRLVHLVNPQTAESFTYSTHTIGGLNAVSDLGDQVTQMRRARPGAIPIVALHAAPMQTKHGRKSKPVLRVVDWRFPAEAAPKLIEAAPALTPPATMAPPASPAPMAAGGRVADDMNDVIPF
jgi:hypothetical protein